MPSPSPEIVELLSVFAIAFTAPTWKNGLVLLFGAILTPGRRTVTSALRVMGLEDDPRFEKYHRVLNRNRWQPLLLSKLLLGLIIGLCVPAGMPLLLAVDETLERRWGPKINYLGYFKEIIIQKESGAEDESGQSIFPSQGDVRSAVQGKPWL